MKSSLPPAASVAQSKFRGQMLTKIYRVWLVRKLLPALLVEIGILSLALYALGRTVFVERIVANALSVFFARPLQIIPFFFSAFGHASSLAKLLTVGAAVLVALLIRHLTQGLLRFILVKENYFGKIEKGN
ncbi:MAG: hypothetical protein HY006_00665 [Candidatus Sungbacteria bacterium]|nr:hypothetical protein [Candidatus Sungbacteria bacterium]